MPVSPAFDVSCAPAAVPSPDTPHSAQTGVWSVSHQNLSSLAAAAADAAATAPRASSPNPIELVTEVTFYWTEPANSAFVTGTFNNWEATIPMAQVDGTNLWTASKTLTPGEYQYKFIIDNVWRHAPDQSIAHDERGIVNNLLSVTIESCGDPTCFCFRLAANRPTPVDDDHAAKQRKLTAMTPRTERRMAKSTGVAYRYVERPPATHTTHDSGPRSYMHNVINDRPFDVTVVNVSNLNNGPPPRADPVVDGMMSRVSSWEDIPGHPLARYTPGVPVVHDAAYAAALRNDRDSSLPRTAAGRATMNQSDPTELAFSVRARFSDEALGFDPLECHKGILLTDTCHCAVRVQEAGLYKTVRARMRVPVSRDVYVEIFVHKSSSSGGVCLGLSTRELPLSCLVGTRPNSIGFSTSGNLIRTVDGKERWSPFGKDSGSGCAVGMLVRLDDDHEGATGRSSSGDLTSDSRGRMSRRTATIEYYVDGNLVGKVDNFTFLGHMDVFPTVSLFARNARVYSLFNGADMLFASALPENRDICTVAGERINRDSGNTPHSLGFDQ